MAKKCSYNFFFDENVFREEKLKTSRDKELSNLFSSFSFLSKLPFLDVYIYKGNQRIHSLVHGRFSWSTFNLHLVRGPVTWPKGFIK